MSSDDGTGVAGDGYTGLDRFGRVDEQNWYNTSTDASIVDIQYGYDDDGNVLYQNNTLESSQSELFTYDDLGQLTSFERGTLSDDDTEIASPSISETWGYDPLGNHLNDSTTTTGTVTITSTFNYDNQVASISSGTTPAYDADGNMTTDQSGLQYVYDAWGHVVTVKNSGGTTLESYSYDGRGFRMTNTVGSTTTNLFNSTAEQVLEEQAASSGYYTARYVWSVIYVNQMIDRDTDTSGTGLTPTGSGFARAWPLADADYNTVALVVMSGGSASVVERYAYDPFGAVTYMDGSYTVLSASAYAWVYLFQGGRMDLNTGDTHFGARNENSALGVWTSEDPLGFAGGDVDLYGFVDNDPANASDPSGLVSSRWLIGYGSAPASVGAYPDSDDPDYAPSFGFYQQRGSRSDIGAGRWSQPDRAGTGDAGIIEDHDKYPCGAMSSTVTVTAQGTAGGVCNTPITETSDPNPDKAMAGSIYVQMNSFASGNYKVTYTWKVSITADPGSVGATVNVFVNQDGKWKQAATYVLSGKDQTSTVTMERSGGNYSSTVPVGDSTYAGLIRVVPVIAGQTTGNVKVEMMVGVINVEKK